MLQCQIWNFDTFLIAYELYAVVQRLLVGERTIESNAFAKEKEIVTRKMELSWTFNDIIAFFIIIPSLLSLEFLFFQFEHEKDLKMENTKGEKHVFLKFGKTCLLLFLISPGFSWGFWIFFLQIFWLEKFNVSATNFPWGRTFSNFCYSWLLWQTHLRISMFPKSIQNSYQNAFCIANKNAAKEHCKKLLFT